MNSDLWGGENTGFGGLELVLAVGLWGFQSQGFEDKEILGYGGKNPEPLIGPKVSATCNRNPATRLNPC